MILSTFLQAGFWLLLTLIALAQFIALIWLLVVMVRFIVLSIGK